MFKFFDKKKKPILQLELYDVEDVFDYTPTPLASGLPKPVVGKFQSMKIVPVIHTQAYDAVDPYKPRVK